MLLLLIAHLVAALVAPALIAWIGRRAFLLLALVPGSAAVWALNHTRAVMAGDGPVSSVAWVPSLGIELSFRLDSLSWLLVLMVGGIGAGVLVYCSRYFSSRSTGLGRFAAILTAFAGAMLGLVTGANLILVFVFWELTTVFSYLLIGHYSDRVSSRRAAMKAILVTTLGGMAMLVGVVLLGAEAGTFDMSAIVAAPPKTTVAMVAVGLLLVGAISKSALIPFHFWLPAAMAAPTPVSAYLHAAAMVKAGVYLVGRFAPAYSTTAVWQVTLAILGCATLLFGGYLALRQYDLKLILAFGTISQLGLLIILMGSPFKSLALAGMALLGAHAMFKACLFLTVGVVDAATGTRDIRRLSGLGKMMPITAVVAGLAVASMIGLVPFSGYVAKEAALEALLDPEQTILWWKWIVIGSFAIGSALTIAYGVRLWWGAFATKPSGTPRYPIVVTAPPLLLIGPPALLAVAGLATALLPNLGEALLAPYANKYPLGLPGHLALWNGWTPALALTLVVFVLGMVVFFIGDRVRWLPAWPTAWQADRLYRHTLRRIDNLAGDVTSILQRGSLPFYLGGILLVTVVLAGGAMVLFVAPPDQVTLGLAPAEVGVSVLIITATVLAARSRRRLKAVVLAGITGYGTAMTFLLYGAPDLALTQVLVETVTLVVFVLVLRRLPVYFSDRPLAATRWVRVAIGAMVGILFGAFALIVPGSRVHEPVSVLFPDEAVAFGGGSNIVNVTLVDIRAWDTLGEIAVLLAAATGIASLIFLRRRSGEMGDISDTTGVIGGSDPDPMASLRSRSTRSTATGAGAMARQWLVAGATLAPQRRSVILEVATRFLYHPMLVFSLFLLFSGHNAPGGGFVAGLVTGIALVLRYLAGGRYELSAAAPLQAGVLLGTGLFLSASMGLAAMAFGGEALQSAILEWDLPVIGHFKVVTSVFFDVGVYLVVVGLMLDILRSLGAEIDRQGELSGLDSEMVGPALEPAPPFRRGLS